MSDLINNTCDLCKREAVVCVIIDDNESRALCAHHANTLYPSGPDGPRDIVGSWNVVGCEVCGLPVEKVYESTADVHLEFHYCQLFWYHRYCWNELNDPDYDKEGYDESTNPSNGWRSPR